MSTDLIRYAPGEALSADELVSRWSVVASELDQRSVLSRLCGECIKLFKHIAVSESVKDRVAPYAVRQLDRSRCRLILWADAYRVPEGGLDEAADESRYLRRKVLRILSSIAETLIERFLPKLRLQESFITEKLESCRQEALTSIQQDYRDRETHDSASESDGSDSDLSVSSEIEDTVESLETDTQLLMDLDRFIQAPSSLISSDHKIAEEVPLKEWQPEDAFAQIIRTRFPEAIEKLVNALAKANLSRMQKCIEGGQAEPEQEAVVITARAVPTSTLGGKTLNDSGYGTMPNSSLREAPSRYAETVMSYAAGDRTVKIPPLPAGAKEGKPFECVACSKKVCFTRSKMWKRHLFSDLQPWTCVEPDCSAVSATFQTRETWAQHLEFDHEYGPAWLSRPCALCKEPTGDGFDACTKHLSNHLEEISLAALPRPVDEEDVSQLSISANSSEAEETWACDQCDQVFDRPHKLNHHLRYHDKEHKCPHEGCGKGFGTKTHLQRHVQDRHARTKKYYCAVQGCQYSRGVGKGFLRKDNWRRHMTKIHDMDAAEYSDGEHTVEQSSAWPTASPPYPRTAHSPAKDDTLHNLESEHPRDYYASSGQTYALLLFDWSDGHVASEDARMGDLVTLLNFNGDLWQCQFRAGGTAYIPSSHLAVIENPFKSLGRQVAWPGGMPTVDQYGFPEVQSRSSSISFLDAIGRGFILPLRLCSTMEEMDRLVQLAFADVIVLKLRIQKRHYRFVDQNLVVIRSRTWALAVQPGSKVRMVLHALDPEVQATEDQQTGAQDPQGIRADVDLPLKRTDDQGQDETQGSRQARDRHVPDSGSHLPATASSSQEVEVANPQIDGSMQSRHETRDLYDQEWTSTEDRLSGEPRALWRKIKAHPDSYIMSRDEYAIFNTFRDSLADDALAGDLEAKAAKRYWDNMLVPTTSNKEMTMAQLHAQQQQQRLAMVAAQGMQQQQNPIDISRMSGPDKARVMQLAQKLMENTSEQAKTATRDQLQKYLTPAQLSECQVQGKDPLVLMYQTQALNMIRQSAVALNRQQAGMGQNVNAPQAAMMQQQQKKLGSPLSLANQTEANANGEDASNSTAKQHKCPHCSKTFTRNQNLKSHLLTHSQEKPFACATCDMRFWRLHDLERHNKLHVVAKSHTCPHCAMSFQTENALAEHRESNCEGSQSTNPSADEGPSRDVAQTDADTEDSHSIHENDPATSRSAADADFYRRLSEEDSEIRSGALAIPGEESVSGNPHASGSGLRREPKTGGELIWDWNTLMEPPEPFFAAFISADSDAVNDKEAPPPLPPPYFSTPGTPDGLGNPIDQSRVAFEGTAHDGLALDSREFGSMTHGKYAPPGPSITFKGVQLGAQKERNTPEAVPSDHRQILEPPIGLPHTCHDCHSRFADADSLFQHNIQVHWPQGDHKCSFCGLLFRQQEGLQLHLSKGCPQRYEYGEAEFIPRAFRRALKADTDTTKTTDDETTWTGPRRLTEMHSQSGPMNQREDGVSPTLLAERDARDSQRILGKAQRLTDPTERSGYDALGYTPAPVRFAGYSLDADRTRRFSLSSVQDYREGFADAIDASYAMFAMSSSEPSEGKSKEETNATAQGSGSTEAAAFSWNLDEASQVTSGFMRDFRCCGKTLPDLHDLLQHYEETHANDDEKAPRTGETWKGEGSRQEFQLTQQQLEFVRASPYLSMGLSSSQGEADAESPYIDNNFSTPYYQPTSDQSSGTANPRIHGPEVPKTISPDAVLEYPVFDEIPFQPIFDSTPYTLPKKATPSQSGVTLTHDRRLPKLERTMTDIYGDELYNPNFAITSEKTLSTEKMQEAAAGSVPNLRRTADGSSKLDRTMADVLGDQLYDPNFEITPTARPGPSQAQGAATSSIFQQRLMAANQHHEAESQTASLHSRSPFRTASPLDPERTRQAETNTAPFNNGQSSRTESSFTSSYVHEAESVHDWLLVHFFPVDAFESLNLHLTPEQKAVKVRNLCTGAHKPYFTIIELAREAMSGGSVAPLHRIFDS